MNKIGIVTINDNNNYRNRLQNYVVQHILKQYEDVNVHNVLNKVHFNRKQKNILEYIIKKLKSYLGNIKRKLDLSKKRRRECFYDFNLNIKYTKKCFNASRLNGFEDFDFFMGQSC